MIINAKDIFSKIIIRQVQYNDSGTTDLYPPPKLFPNLISFEYMRPCVCYDEWEGQIPFFQLNTQLEILKLSGNIFNWEILNTIKDYQNLTHLEYKCGYHRDLYDSESPTLLNVSHLYLIDDIYCAYDYNTMFPNVSSLVIEYNRIFYLSNFQNAIGNYPKLKSLKLIYNICSEEIFDLAIAEVSCWKS
jgi:Leucine-rich repeat (LRR) protein